MDLLGQTSNSLNIELQTSFDFFSYLLGDIEGLECFRGKLIRGLQSVQVVFKFLQNTYLPLINLLCCLTVGIGFI